MSKIDFDNVINQYLSAWIKQESERYAIKLQQERSYDFLLNYLHGEILKGHVIRYDMGGRTLSLATEEDLISDLAIHEETHKVLFSDEVKTSTQYWAVKDAVSNYRSFVGGADVVIGGEIRYVNMKQWLVRYEKDENALLETLSQLNALFSEYIERSKEEIDDDPNAIYHLSD